ncbi:MAG: hypothetical protein Q8L55_10765 [Phycisphaerales bacterium]|nr:hypothetical protein [Phycisphaerales bacterium]
MMRALSLLIAMFIATTAAEAQIKYRIGTFVADTAPITWPTGGGWQSLAGGSDVSLGTLTSTSDIVVQIADQSPQTNGNPSITADLGLLRLIAGSGSVAPRRVRVWIANAALDPLSGLIDTSSQSWTPGIHDWTGRLQCLNSSHVKWEELADAVHLNANISHNYGDTTNPGAGNQGNGNESIDCGSIIRFSTNGIQDDPSDVEAGQINGFFRGRRNYVPVGHSPSSLDNAVGVIVARHGVWGAICAGDAPMDVTAAPVLIIDDELINGASLGSADNLANIGSV